METPREVEAVAGHFSDLALVVDSAMGTGFPDPGLSPKRLGYTAGFNRATVAWLSRDLHVADVLARNLCDANGIEIEFSEQFGAVAVLNELIR